MLPFRTILVAADFSESSRDAFRAACALSRSDKTRLSVLHVAKPLYSVEEPVYLGQQRVPFAAIERDPGYDKSVMERLRQSYVPDPPFETEYRERDGDPATEILRAAEELPCDLIVMGTHGRTGLRRALMGSVAEAVLRGAGCPVLTVKAPAPVAVAARAIRS